MKRVNLREFPKFWIDYRTRVIELTQDLDMSEGAKIIRGWYGGSATLIKDWYGFNIEYGGSATLIKDWYGFNIELDWAGSLGEVFMSDQDYTLFVLKYG